MRRTASPRSRRPAATTCSASRRERRRDDHVGGQHDLDAALLGRRRCSPCTVSIWSASSRLEPTLWPWAARKVNSMPPPMSSVSTRGSRCAMTPSLSQTFEPPSTTVYGRSGFSVSRSSTSSSVAISRPAALGSSSLELVDARLLAMHDAEAVRDDRVAEARRARRRTRARSASSFDGLAGVEPEVLEHERPRRRRAPRRLRRGIRTDRVGRERDRLRRAARRAAARPARGCTSASGAPSGRPRWETHDDAGALVDERVRGWGATPARGHRP